MKAKLRIFPEGLFVRCKRRDNDISQDFGRNNGEYGNTIYVDEETCKKMWFGGHKDLIAHHSYLDIGWSRT